MATNLAIDDSLIETARVLGGHRTKKAAVVMALEQYIAHERQTKMIAMFGTVDFDSDHDYKSERQRKANPTR